MACLELQRAGRYPPSCILRRNERHFVSSALQRVTGFSPLAFQRHIRLLEARKLLAGGLANVSRVAYDVGYVSPSQFSREYKSMFGIPPVADLQR
ncbi:helix-turn-helix transcriptional regulator (plasmid) [Rhizobium johnstonii]|nr:helix-turn-helix transcriptional regulator [Rhizobium johnstonii]